ncbi:MAG: AAA family ATPase, partial [Candidatus Nitrosotenuis sp.]|nr:AAA family ATPase [Candidatus Nitrosotenuis sp.]
MRLRKFRVRAYRCIHDSGEIKVGDLAAFVGRNESGKTTILQALTLLNKEERVSELDLCDEMTEELKSEVILAEGDFELSKNETKIIKERFPHLPEITHLKIFRTNKIPQVQYDFGSVKVSDEKNKALNSWENYTEKVLNFISTIPNHIRIQFDTKFFEGPAPTDKTTFMQEMTMFNNTLNMLAADEP